MIKSEKSEVCKMFYWAIECLLFVLLRNKHLLPVRYFDKGGTYFTCTLAACATQSSLPDLKCNPLFPENTESHGTFDLVYA